MRWNERRAQAAYADGWWVRRSLGEALGEAARTSPERVVVVDGDVRLDSATLHARAAALARSMLAHVAPGSVVSFMLPNWHEAASIYLAAQLAGMIANPLLPSLRDRELRFALEDIESRLLFIPSHHRGHDYGAMLSRVTGELSAPPLVVTVRGEKGPHLSFDAFCARATDGELPEVDPDGVRLALYTSGTTGRPKAVLHSQNSIHALVRQIGAFWHVRQGDRFLVASPISHIGGSIYAFELPLLLETSAVLLERWDASLAVEVLTRERCTHMAGATPFLHQLLDAAKQASTRLPGLKVFICGGASVPPALIRDAAEHFERTIVTRVYGSTEVPVTTVGAPDRGDLTHAAETDGRVPVADVKLVDASERIAGESEVRVRGPQMFVGYLRAEDDEAGFDEEGYYRTGDLGRWVDGNYLLISGRAKDIIIRNGENISPREVEDCLREHPNIAEVAIVGLPDSRTGERACAAIVPRRAPVPDVAELAAFLRALGVASFKFPEQVCVFDALPKNDAGKTLKHEIRAQLLGGRS